MKKKIMIVDDDGEFLEELKETLELSGYEPVALNDVDEALAAAREIEPALVLIDLKMPKKSGFQLANELRYIPAFNSVPIIALSAFYKDEYRPLLEMCGIRKCLSKPFQPLDVIAEIEDVLRE